jgi:hypothetical protein
VKPPGSRLRDAFLEDHRVLTRGLKGLKRAVEEGELGRAARLADELDRAAGPHIEFEERAFYPELRRTFGNDFVDQLYREHGAGQRALRMLQAHGGGRELGADERASLADDLDVAVQHALSCGSLTSHMDALPGERQQSLLDELERTRRGEARWTEHG